MTQKHSYLRPMPSDPDLKRLAWRAHHRGTKEADILIGGFFDAHHQQWGSRERALFESMLEEQDVDIMAWAMGSLPCPPAWEGAQMQAMRAVNYVTIPN